MTDATSLGLIASTAVLNALGLVGIKRALGRCGPFPLLPVAASVRYVAAFLRRPDGLAGLAAFFVAPAGFVAGLRGADLLIAYPTFLGLSFVLTVLLAVTVLHERWSPLRATGMLLILAGVLLLQIGSR